MRLPGDVRRRVRCFTSVGDARAALLAVGEELLVCRLALGLGLTIDDDAALGIEPVGARPRGRFRNGLAALHRAAALVALEIEWLRVVRRTRPVLPTNDLALRCRFA